MLKKISPTQLLEKLNTATEAQTEALLSPHKGSLATIFTIAQHGFTALKTARALAQALNIPPENKNLFNKVSIRTIATKATEHGLPGTERLEHVLNWHASFWTAPEVKTARHINPLKSIQLLKSLAQKHTPKP